MGEMLRRRLNRAVQGDEKFLPLPDLILVDGGRGQLSVAEQVIGEFGLSGKVALAALAKEHEDVYVPGQAEPVDMTHHPRAQFLLQRIRDEAHRFAITFHRQRRSKASTGSVLDSIPGIGKKRRRAMLRHFGSLKKIKAATLEELSALPEMNQKAAEAVITALAAG